MSTISYRYHPHIIEEQQKAEAAFLARFDEGDHPFDAPLVLANPYLIAPLTALILFRLPKSAAVTVTVKGKSQDGDMSFTAAPNTTHILPVCGLYADYRNQIVLTLDDGRSQSIFIQTDPAPANIPVPEYVQTTPEYFGDQVMFVSPSSFSKMVAYDYAGDLRWYTTLDVVFDIKRAANGRLWIATERLLALPYVVTGIYEMSTVGKIYHEYRLPGGTHHDYVEDKDGNIIILTQDFSRDTVEDLCVVLDRETGQVIKTFDLKALLPATAAAGNRASAHDWLHNNAVWYDQRTNSLSFSGRNLDAVINVDYASGQINWILGDSRKWPQEYVDRYFLTPEDDSVEWFYAQHACIMLPDGDIFLFDNGAWRSKFAAEDIDAHDKYSRGVRYQLDLERRTVRQVWQYGKERGSEFFSPHISNVDYYGEGHYLIHSGDIGQINGIPCEKPPIFYLGKPEEAQLVYYATTTELLDDQVVYEMKIASNAYYRAKKMRLYDARDQLTFGPAQLLGTLGTTPTVRVKLPAAPALPLADHYQASLEDEIDRFRFSVLLETGAYACLILKNTQETRAYLIPTTEKDELAMCVGTFQPTNVNEAFITVSKDGLSGPYSCQLLIEQTLYDLDWTLTF